jgi:chemotaxis-related protein WspD
MVTSSAINDCWNKIGVWGDGSCPELIKYIHCRNCPVYSAAAVKLLDRELPKGYIAEWTSHFAQETPAAAQDTNSVLIFRLGSEWLALSTIVFEEVSELKTIHSLPHQRNDIVLGLINIRGELLVGVSIAKALGLGETAQLKQKSNHTVHGRMLVVSSEGHRFVFPVDEVGGIHHFSLKEVKKVPTTVAGAGSTYTTGLLSWRDKSVGCLNDQLLFYTLNKSLS